MEIHIGPTWARHSVLTTVKTCLFQDSFIARHETRLLQGSSVPLTTTFAVYATLWLGRQPIYCLLRKPILPIVAVWEPLPSCNKRVLTVILTILFT